jgi:5'-3' exonuclease
MNGIIHKCSHPDDSKLSHLSEAEIFNSIFEYIEHLFLLIRPKKVFFLALDGVAPRAKMNQQRSRRFRTAQETKEKLDEALRKGLPEPKEPPFDSNCITPGKRSGPSHAGPVMTVIILSFHGCRHTVHGQIDSAHQVLSKQKDI